MVGGEGVRVVAVEGKSANEARGVTAARFITTELEEDCVVFGDSPIAQDVTK